MGQKVHPFSNRLGYTRPWISRWYVKKGAADLLEEDQRIRKYIRGKLTGAMVSRVDIERPGGRWLRIYIHTARPGIVIGQKGQTIEQLRRDISEMTGRGEVDIRVQDITAPSLEAQILAEDLARQIERNISYRRAMRRIVENAMESGALGCKAMLTGRLGGGEYARTDWYRAGRVPLATFRADIDYGFAEAHTKLGRIGVKVWVFRKEEFIKTEEDLIEQARRAAREESRAQAAASPPPSAAPQAGPSPAAPQIRVPGEFELDATLDRPGRRITDIPTDDFEAWLKQVSLPVPWSPESPQRGSFPLTPEQAGALANLRDGETVHGKFVVLSRGEDRRLVLWVLNSAGDWVGEAAPPPVPSEIDVTPPEG